MTIWRKFLKVAVSAVLLAAVTAVAVAQAASGTALVTPPGKAPAPLAVAPAQKTSVAHKPYHYHTRELPKSGQQFFSMMWGVDSFSVKSLEAGEIIRFSYRVLEPAKAKLLNNKKAEPALIDREAGVSLVVPTMEKVGQLRQTATQEVGKVYWMAFSNKGRKVKPGHHVSVAIGTFRVDGLVVE